MDIDIFELCSRRTHSDCSVVYIRGVSPSTVYFEITYGAIRSINRNFNHIRLTSGHDYRTLT